MGRMNGIQCRCGRYLAKAHAIAGRSPGDYGDWCLADVRGDCSRCGTDVQAGREGDMCWWWAWDVWNFVDLEEV